MTIFYTCRRYVLACLSLLLILSHPVAAAESALERILSSGELRVAMSGDQQPFNFSYGKKKTLVGLDVDLAKELARTMSVELKIVQTPFSDLLGTLEKGDADLAISGMTITAERTSKVSFVGPYVLSGKSILLTESANRKLDTPGNFNQPNLRLTALEGSTSESLIANRLPAASLMAAKDYEAAIGLLLDGKADGMVADLPILAYTKNRNGRAQFQLAMPPLTVEPMVIALAKGSLQLENYLRSFLAVSEKTGTLQRLYAKWFEGGSGELYR